MDLKGKVAIVTGASYGIGYNVCLTLMSNGFKVYGISRTKPEIKDDNFVWLKLDLLNLEEVKNVSKKISEPNINLLVNNAGTHIEEPALKVTSDIYNKVFDLNFKSQIFLTSGLALKLKRGLIVNISSTSDRYVDVGSALYSASKAALQIFFNTLALENKNIKVVNVLPDYVDTPLQHKISDGSNFDWDLCIKSNDVSELIISLVTKKYNVESGSNVIICNSKTESDDDNPEKLWSYNVDTKKFKQIK